MAYYLYEGAYTPAALKVLTKKPVNRFDIVKKSIEKLGGSVEGAWFTFGDNDFLMVLQMPDNVSAAALSLAVSAGGAIKNGKTTPLLTITEGLAAMKRAGTCGYQPPR